MDIETLAITITPNQAIEFVESALMAKRVPFLRGSPGIGKSDIAKTVADNFNLELIDIRLSQCDPTDLNGFPTIVNGKAEYIPMNIFPLEKDQPPAGKSGWLIMFDELPSAMPAIQAAAYKILLDKCVGMHKLNSKVAMMAAGNKETDNAVAYAMSTALQSRMIHAELEVSFNDWMEWADKNNVHTMVKFFLKFKPDLIYNFKPDHADNTYACPRTWVFLSDLMHNNLDVTTPTGMALAAGTVGQGAAREFFAWTENFTKIPDMATILANPTGTPVPVEMGIKFALAGALASAMDTNNASTLMKYVVRMDLEFNVLTMREAIRRDPKIRTDASVKSWLKENLNELA